MNKEPKDNVVKKFEEWDVDALMSAHEEDSENNSEEKGDEGLDDISKKEIERATESIGYDVEKKVFYIVQNERFEKEIKKLKRYSKFLNFPEPKVNKLTSGAYRKLIRYKGDEEEVLIETNDSIEFENYLSQNNITKEIRKYANGNSYAYFKRGSDKFRLDSLPYTTKYEVEMVNGVKPLHEWVILGTINFKDGLVNDAPDQQVPKDMIPSNLYGKSHCDHCNSTRNRNKIVIIENQQTGDVIQVGGSCITYYLGYNYQKIISMLNLLTKIQDLSVSEWDEDMYGSGKLPEKVYSANGLIRAYIYQVESTNSHMTKKQAQAYNDKINDTIAEIEDSEDSEDSENKASKLRHKRATSVIVSDDLSYYSYPPEKGSMQSSSDHNIIFNEWLKESNEFFENIVSISSEKVNEVISFIESKVGESNFMFNALNKIKEGEVTFKVIPIIAGTLSYFYAIKFAEIARKEREEAKKKESSNNTSVHIGTVGEKTAFSNLTVKKISGFETDFGWTNVYKLEDENGNSFTKFGTINDRFLVEGDEVEEGSKLSFTADIKKHDEYQGVKQTTLGRLSKYNPKLQY